MAVYYLGVYGYGVDITAPSERATRLVRFDGVERRQGFVVMLGRELQSVLVAERDRTLH